MTKFCVGQKVSWRLNRPRKLNRWNKNRQLTGIGHITRVALPLRNLPYTFIVDSFPSGVLFEDELEAL